MSSPNNSNPLPPPDNSPAPFHTPLSTHPPTHSIPASLPFTSPAHRTPSNLPQSAPPTDLFPPDPWSPRLPISSSSDSFAIDSSLQGTINESSLPLLYHQAFSATDPAGGTASMANVHRVLASSGVGASVIEQILSASCGRSSRVSKSEFSIALAAVAFVQQGRPPSAVQRVIARKASFPHPTLDLGPLAINTVSRNHSRKSSLPDDPWCTSPASTLKVRSAPGSSLSAGLPLLAEEANPGRLSDHTQTVGARFLPTSVSPGQRDAVLVRLSAPEGWILKYNVYAVDHERKGTSVPRRYSDFAWLHDCLLKRYPFRLVPSLPPKRVAIAGRHVGAGDENQFLERRRRGLQRFLTFLVNHPVLSTDTVLETFLSEPSDLATWRSHSRVHLAEESSTSRLTPAEEMSIPEDLENRLSQFRSRLPLIIEHWSRICAGLERVVRRNEAQVSDLTRIQVAIGSAVESGRAGLGGGSGRNSRSSGEEWRAEEETELAAQHIGKLAELVEQRSGRLSAATSEQVRAHRELFTDFMGLFGRVDRLSGDDVDRTLKPRADANTRKLDEVREAARPGWEDEVDRLKNLIEVDRAGIEAKLKRRVFIRWSLAQELGHLARAAGWIGAVWKEFGEDERRFCERTLRNWSEMGEVVQQIGQ